ADPSKPSRVKPGPADAQIWDDSGGPSIAVQMAQPVTIDGRRYKGLTWEPSDKSRGSRKNGWEAIRTRLENSMRKGGNPREKPGMFVVSDCRTFIEVVPPLSRDLKDPEDIDT